MFNFTKLIHNTFKSNYPITIVSKVGSWVDGKYEETISAGTVITGSCMNISGKDLKLLPENFRFEFSRQLFTTIEVPVNTDVEYRGKRYKVILSDLYDDIQQSGHWKSILKLYSDGYKDAGQETIREPELSDDLTPDPITGGHYENGVWIDG